MRAPEFPQMARSLQVKNPNVVSIKSRLSDCVEEGSLCERLCVHQPRPPTVGRQVYFLDVCLGLGFEKSSGLRVVYIENMSSFR